MSTLQERLADKLNLKPVNHYFYGCCPFHSDNSPSFILYPDYFICKSASCGRKGKIEYLEQELSSGILIRSSNSHKSQILPRWKKWEERYGDMEGIANAAHKNVLGGNWMYFKRRKIDQFIKQGKFGLLDQWALFPVLNAKGQVIDIVVRAIRQPNVKYIIRPYSESEMRPLYIPNWERVNKANYILVVYGIITAWACEAIGEPCVTGITGKSLNPDALKPFQKKIIVIPDYNEEKDGAKLVSQLGWRGRVMFMDWPDGCEDLDDIRVKYSNDILKQMIGVAT